MRSFLIILLFAAILPFSAQTPSFEELVFETDSMVTPYKPTNKNYVFIKSKRGSDGVTKTSRADSILPLPVTEIVLVFSELNSSSINSRIEANQERWENLLKVYPQFFQFSTILKEMCQCKIGGDTALFKKGQGFYIYFAGEEPKAVEKKVETSVSKIEKNAVKEDKPVLKNNKLTEKAKEEEDNNSITQGPEETLTIDMSKEGLKKKVGYNKPKRSKNTKACRPPCYEGGFEDLNLFFKDNIALNKKQRRQVKSDMSVVKLQLNFDGSIKKATVTGTNPALNEMVTVAIKNMNLWNPAVKAGVTIKSEVKLTLKYDKTTKAIKPFEVIITPRPNPKCIECKSDAEIFGAE